MGKEKIALALARRNIDAWMREIEGEGLDAIVVTASGCGTTIKDYGFMFRTEPGYAEKAAKVASLARDASEYLSAIEISPPTAPLGFTVAYQAPCSLQHGQKITRLPKDLLGHVGFTVKDIPEAHMCCGSAGTYNILQPDLAQQLAERKAANIARVEPDVIASSNLGCMLQIGQFTSIPIVHLVELVDWATGGPPPKPLQAVDLATRLLHEHEPA